MGKGGDKACFLPYPEIYGGTLVEPQDPSVVDQVAERLDRELNLDPKMEVAWEKKRAEEEREKAERLAQGEKDIQGWIEYPYQETKRIGRGRRR